MKRILNTGGRRFELGLICVLIFLKLKKNNKITNIKTIKNCDRPKNIKE